MRRWTIERGGGRVRRATVGAALLFVLGALPAVADEGPVLLKDLSPGTASGNPRAPVVSNGNVFFRATDGVTGFELWKSDGTSDGTVLVKDTQPGSGSGLPLSALDEFMVDVGGTLFFVADDGVNGAELWKSDGSAAGTVLIKDIRPGGAGSDPARLTNVGGTLFFAADDGVVGRELWKSDGTEGGTALVKDIRSGANQSAPSDFAALGSALIFRATGDIGGSELWRSDGTAGGTFLLEDVAGGNSFPQELTVVGATVFFRAQVDFDLELWKTDGTAEGTAPVRDINPSGSDNAQRLTNVGGTLFFMATDGSTGNELYASDGTPGGTVLVKDIRPGAENSAPSGIVDVDGTAYFRADDGVNGFELWKSDGTAGGTVLVADINPGAASSDPVGLLARNGILYLNADDGTHGSELWTSDGTAGGTALVEDIAPGAVGAMPFYATVVNGTLVFRAYEPSTGVELWTCATDEPAVAPEPAPSFLSVANVTRRKRGRGRKVRLRVVANLDVGPGSVDFTSPTTVTLGDTTIDIPGGLVDESGPNWSFRSGSRTLTLSRRQPSRYLLTVADTNSRQAAEGPVAIRFENDDVDAEALVTLTRGSFRAGRAGHALAAPALALDSFRVFGSGGRFTLQLRFPTDGATAVPAAAPDVVIRAGDFVQEIPAAEFTRIAYGYRFFDHDVSRGLASGVQVLVLDTRRGIVWAEGRGADLGTFEFGNVPLYASFGRDGVEHAVEVVGRNRTGAAPVY